MKTKEEFNTEANLIQMYIEEFIMDCPFIEDAQIAYDKQEDNWIIDLRFIKDPVEKGLQYRLESKNYIGVINGLQDFENTYAEYEASK